MINAGGHGNIATRTHADRNATFSFGPFKLIPAASCSSSTGVP